MNRPLAIHRQQGFTLIELVTVTVLIAILAVLGGQLILAPIQSFTDVSRRAELVDIADNALQRMSRELRNALPNSIRITVSGGGRTALEFLNTTAGGRYRARVESGGGGDPLQNASTDTFDVIGGITGTVTPGPAGRANCLNGSSDCLVLYNTGTGAGDFNAYAAESANTDNIAAITAAGANQLSFDNGAGWSFPFPIPPSSEQRFYVVDMPVSFVCDSSTRELRRYEDYGIQAVQPVTDTDLGGPGALLADNIPGCAFSYSGGAGTRHGLVTLRVQVQDTATSESVALLYQVHVVNVP